VKPTDVDPGRIQKVWLWGMETPGAEALRWSAVDARIEAPRGIGCREGVSHPYRISIFELKKASFGAFWMLFFGQQPSGEGRSSPSPVDPPLMWTDVPVCNR